MLAFIFPGQGSQYKGMGKDFYDDFPIARQVFEESSDRIGMDMAELCFNSDEEELSLTANAQPAILTASIAIHNVLRNEIEIEPDYVAGHSLGEYTALVASGAMNFSDAVYTVRKRGEFMQNSVPLGVGTMAAIIGLSGPDIIEICNSVSGPDNIVSPANFNSSVQTVISGHTEAVQKASEKAKESGAKRVVPLNVSAPFHCVLMSDAAEKLREVLSGVIFNDLSVPVVTNVYAEANTDNTKILDIMVDQMVKPVKWMDSVKYMYNCNVDRFIEIGPGNVLTGLIKRTVSGVNLANLEKTEQLNHIRENGI